MLQFSVFSSSLFFFKQKTAYEMRISDWSSDVCSSDLPVEEQQALRFVAIAVDLHEGVAPAGHPHDLAQCGDHAIARQVVQRVDRDHGVEAAVRERQRPGVAQVQAADHLRLAMIEGVARSEEHTSELQSLMRISYAVFCLKQKNYHS